MADTKLTALAELTTPADGDLLYIVDDPAGTPVSKKIQLANVLSLQFGQVYTTGGSGTQTPGTSYAKLTQFDSNGLSNGPITPDATNNKITVNQTGIYYISFNVSFSGSTNSTVFFRTYWNGVAQPQGTLERKLSNADVGAAAMSCLVDVTTASTDIEIYVKTDGASDVVDVKEAQLIIFRVAAT